MRANLSVMGAYLYNENLFAEMVLPAPMANSKQLVVENLVAELEELELVHTNIDTLPLLIGVWSRKQLPVWEKLYETLLYEYNPIHNYDRHEVWNETRDTSNTYTTDNTGHGNRDGTSDTSAESLDKVAGMNDPAAVDGAMANRSKTESKSNTTDTEETDVTSHSESLNVNEHANEHTSHIYGNIGVTTSQQMIEAQREVVKFNMVDVIIADFKGRFCLPIY